MEIIAKELSHIDCMALGEVMLRLDPGVDRIRKTDQFRVWEGGGEYNVIQGLSSCFGHKTGIITALVDNEVGHLIAGLVQRAGVSTDWIEWKEHDGIGRSVRNGMYFMERGFGERGAKAVMDRGHTPISQLTVKDIDWDALFAKAKPRWFHVGGVMAALSESSPSVVEASMIAAKKHGAIVSYDLNYRASLWKDRGGREAANACNARLTQKADVLFGIESLPREVDTLDKEVFSEALHSMKARFPNVQLFVTTMRIVKDASHNDWGGLCLHNGEIFASRDYNNLPIFDRVGGGDAFAAGLIHGLLNDQPMQTCIDLAAAHGALVMSTAGDNSMSSKEEVYAYAGGAGAAANR
ncbi:sugar kinase [Marinomonas algicola]|uniref:sugar kinase n=1 Tax=Marinomonas algicola TaxID=2773454 RepID=UPI0019D601D9|nr:sugar kinase [Marinomonas algicola]